MEHNAPRASDMMVWSVIVDAAKGTRCIEPDEVTDYLSQDNPKAEGLRAIAGDRIYGMYGNAIYFPRGGT